MKDVVAAIGVVVVLVVSIVVIGFGLPFLNLQVMRFWGTETESVRTDIYRENKSYVEGTVRDLRELIVDHAKASDDHKSAIMSLIRHRAGELDIDRLPVDVRNFLKENGE
jgi:hypothetical protein